MSRTGRASELLSDWRRGQQMEHVHGWGQECLRCVADRDAYDVLCEAASIMHWIDWSEHEQ